MLTLTAWIKPGPPAQQASAPSIETMPLDKKAYYGIFQFLKCLSTNLLEDNGLETIQLIFIFKLELHKKTRICLLPAT